MAHPATCFATLFCQREHQVGADRVSFRREIMSVKRQAGLQPQRVSRAQPNRLDAFIRNQRFSKLRDVRRRHGNLEPVFASIASPTDPEVGTFPLKQTSRHEGERSCARQQCFKNFTSLRALQREQCEVVVMCKRDFIG